MHKRTICECCLVCLVFIAWLVVAASCVRALQAPRIVSTPDGPVVSTTETQSLESDADVERYVDDVMAAYGYEKPTLESEEQIRDRWLRIMTWTAVAAIVALCGWYVSKLREIGGVAFILGGSSIVAGGLAATADKFWMVGVATMVFVAAIVVGFIIKDKSLFEWLASKRTKSTSNVAPTTGV